MNFLQLTTPRRIAQALALSASLLLAGPAPATILTFDQARTSGTVVPTFGGATVPLDYGDAVRGAAMTVPGGQFLYGEAGEGYTPNVDVEMTSGAASPVGAGVSLWETGYGDLDNVLIANNFSDFLALRLVADPGYRVGLFGFDLAGWPNTDYLIDAVRLFGPAGTLLFSLLDVAIEGDFAGPRRTSFDFAEGLFATELLLQIDFGNLAGGRHDNIGLDNLRFGQTNPLPPTSPDPDPQQVSEPGTLALLGATLLAGLLLRRRPRRLSAAAPRSR